MTTLRRRLRAWATSLALSVCGVLASFLLLELCLQLSQLILGSGASLYQSCGDCSYLYGPVPGVGGSNSFGLRGAEVSPRPAPDMRRILLLGDSVTHGESLPVERTYGRHLETLLNRERPTEVLNAGVVGYSAFNEARLYRDKLAALGSDTVIVQTCLNDIVEPELHWSVVSRVPFTIPDEAYPSAERRTPHVLPFLGSLLKLNPLHRSQLFRGLVTLSFSFQELYIQNHVGVDRDGQFWPTYISGQSLSDFTPLLDYGSPESRWLRTQYDLLAESVSAHGARLHLLIVPLSYQLLPGYPLAPEDMFTRYCNERGLACLNLRQALQGHAPEEIFIQNNGPALMPDVWHFSQRGHELVAQALADFLSTT